MVKEPPLVVDIRNYIKVTKAWYGCQVLTFKILLLFYGIGLKNMFEPLYKKVIKEPECFLLTLLTYQCHTLFDEMQLEILSW